MHWFNVLCNNAHITGNIFIMILVVCVPTRRIINGNVICSVKSFEDYLTIIKFGFKWFQKKIAWHMRLEIHNKMSGVAVGREGKSWPVFWVGTQFAVEAKTSHVTEWWAKLDTWGKNVTGAPSLIPCICEIGVYSLIVDLPSLWWPSKGNGGHLNVMEAIEMLCWSFERYGGHPKVELVVRDFFFPTELSARPPNVMATWMFDGHGDSTDATKL